MERREQELSERSKKDKSETPWKKWVCDKSETPLGVCLPVSHLHVKGPGTKPSVLKGAVLAGLLNCYGASSLWYFDQSMSQTCSLGHQGTILMESFVQEHSNCSTVPSICDYIY